MASATTARRSPTTSTSTRRNWGVSVQSQGRERGFQSFAFHPQFGQPGTRGYGKFYTYTDSSNMQPKPDFVPGRRHEHARHGAVRVDREESGGARPTTAVRRASCCASASRSRITTVVSPRSIRLRCPAARTTGCSTSRSPTAAAAAIHSTRRRISARHSARCCASIRSATTARTASTASRPPIRSRGKTGALGEIYAYGVRNPQRFGWDPKDGRLFLSEIGQNIVEELDVVTPARISGGTTGKASFRFMDRTHIDLNQRRADPKVTYPIVEFDHHDPLFGAQVAITGVVVYRGTAIAAAREHGALRRQPERRGLLLSADRLPNGGQDAIRRVLFNSGGSPHKARGKQRKRCCS